MTREGPGAAGPTRAIQVAPPEAPPVPPPSPRQRFRHFLATRASSVDDVAWYLEQAIAAIGSDQEVQIAIEELVDQFGRIAGFDVRRDGHAPEGAWIAPDGARVLVRVTDGPGAIAGAAQMARASERLRLDPVRHGASARGITCVIAGPVDERRLAEVVHVRKTAGLVQFVRTRALERLARACEAGRVTAAQAIAFLQPAPVLADTLLPLLGDAQDAPP